MKKILCPTDFSDAAQNATAYAAKLAQKMNAELTLLNVQSLFDVSPVEIIKGRQGTLLSVKEQLESQCQQIAKAFKISCFAEVEPSGKKLSTVIHEKAKKFNLLVMGSDGPDDLYQLFTGSNTYNAIVKTELPVMIIPADYTYTEINSAVYAFDYLRARNIPLLPVLPILKELKTELTILQVMEEAYSKEAEDDLQELQLMIKAFYKEDINFKYDTIHTSEIAQGIDDYMIRNQADVLVLCSVHHNLFSKLFHKSIIKHISAVCNYPVIVFHQ